MNETLKLIMNRQSVRTFKPDQIEEDKLQAILDAAIQAPNAVNQQMWHFSVIQNKELIAKMGGIIKDRMKNSGVEFLINMANKPGYDPLHHAPTVIFVTSDENAEYLPLTCGLAAENIVIAAASLGLVSCVTTSSQFMFKSDVGEEIKAEFGIPAGNTTVCAVALGYLDGELPPPVPRNRDVINYVR